jgi:hypothetical protein
LEFSVTILAEDGQDGFLGCTANRMKYGRVCRNLEEALEIFLRTTDTFNFGFDGQ